MTKRKKSIRKRETRKRRFVGLRAREIFDVPVSYRGREYTEVHVIANLAGYVLTLRNFGDSSATPVGMRGDYGNLWDGADEHLITQTVENMISAAREGRLRGCLSDQFWSGCLF